MYDLWGKIYINKCMILDPDTCVFDATFVWLIHLWIWFLILIHACIHLWWIYVWWSKFVTNGRRPTNKQILWARCNSFQVLIECNPLELSLINKPIPGNIHHQKSKNITEFKGKKTSPVLGSPSATSGCINRTKHPLTPDSLLGRTITIETLDLNKQTQGRSIEHVHCSAQTTRVVCPNNMSRFSGL